MGPNQHYFVKENEDPRWVLGAKLSGMVTAVVAVYGGLAFNLD